MLTLLLIPDFLYLALLVLVFALQTKMLFPAGSVGGSALLPAGAERLAFDTPDRHRLVGTHFPAAFGSGPRALVLGFGGNAWNADTAAAYLHTLFPEADVVVFHYRGYRPSTGSPSAAGLTADAPLIYDHAVAHLRPARVVAVGFSIGTGVAASLAPKRPLDGLILVTPFDSLTGVAAGQFPWLPVRWLFRHPMPAADWLRAANVPTALIAAERDTLIRPERTAALRAAVPNLAYDRTVPDVGHNDIYDAPAFRSAVREAMAKLGA